MEKKNTERTIPLSEQMAREVLARLQAIGAVPMDAWAKEDLGIVEGLSVSSDDPRLPGYRAIMRERTLIFEWKIPRDWYGRPEQNIRVTMTLRSSVGIEKSLDANKDLKLIEKLVNQEDSRWYAEKLLIENDKATIKLEDQQSVYFFLHTLLYRTSSWSHYHDHTHA